MAHQDELPKPEDTQEDDEYGRFESLARKVVGTPKSSIGSAGEPAEDGSEREEA
jgi:hypothetical protein